MENDLLTLKRYTLLFIEDDEKTRHEFEESLCPFFHTIWVASNGQEGVERFLEKRPDIVVTDIRMPIMDGLQAARAIRQHAPQIPLFIMTAYDDNGYLIDSIGIGVDGYLLKPIELTQLLELLHKRMHTNELRWELERNIQQMEAINSSIGEGVYCIDAQGRMLYVNDAATAMLGFTKEELIGNNACALFHQITPEARQNPCPIHMTMEAGLSFLEREEWFTTKEGSRLPVLVTATPYLKDGAVEGTVVVFRDYTKKREENLQILLSQANMAARGEMIATLAHQWRQPLQVINSSVITLKLAYEMGELQAEELLEGLSALTQHVCDLSGMIQRFELLFQPATRESKEPVGELLEWLATFHAPLLLEKGIQLQLEVEEGLECRVGRGAFWQSLGNLITNAEELLGRHPVQSPRIHITAKKQEHGATIEVCDNGGGIPELLMDKIFEPYFSTKERLNGVGLGLFIAKALIENHCNGTIRAQNRDGGACFTIELPH